MTIAEPVRHVSRQGETVDYICWKHYGTERGTTEAVLEANAGLADKGAVLPLGTVVFLPVLRMPVKEEKLIQLWD